jgi:transglutaminase-like putative cysteine protease
VIVKARGIVDFLAPKDWTGQVKAIHRYVRDQIRYVMDPAGIETLSTPMRLIEIGAGDCDDKSILLASLLEAVNHPTRFVAIGMSGGTLEHVYVETKIGDEWIPLETTEPMEAGILPFAPEEVKNRYVIHN